MEVKKNFKNITKKIKDKIKEFIYDEYGGNLVEYALLIGFALFIFFLIISVITSMLDWTVNQSNDFWETRQNIYKYPHKMIIFIAPDIMVTFYILLVLPTFKGYLAS